MFNYRTHNFVIFVLNLHSKNVKTFFFLRNFKIYMFSEMKKIIKNNIFIRLNYKLQLNKKNIQFSLK